MLTTNNHVKKPQAFDGSRPKVCRSWHWKLAETIDFGIQLAVSLVSRGITAEGLVLFETIFAGREVLTLALAKMV